MTGDPLVAALPPNSPLRLVVEADALRATPAGDAALRCFLSEEHRGALERARDELGVDLAHDVDRVGVTDRVMLLAGRFGDVAWERLAPTHAPRPHGAGSVVYESAEGWDALMVLGVWRDHVIAVGLRADEVEAALDRLEAGWPTRAPSPGTTSPVAVHGALQVSSLAPLLDPTPWGELVRLVRTVELRVTLDGAPTASLRLAPADGVTADELAVTLEAARMVATEAPHPLLVGIGSGARIRSEGEVVHVEVVAPAGHLEALLASCPGEE